jgi:hypothetical protein
MPDYTAWTRWGSAPWNPVGTWVLPGEIANLEVTSTDGGQTFTGSLTNPGSGPLDVRLTLIAPPATPNLYTAETRWGGDSGQWQPAGTWSFGGGAVVQLSLSPPGPDGATLGGGITHPGQGPLTVKAQLQP